MDIPVIPGILSLKPQIWDQRCLRVYVISNWPGSSCCNIITLWCTHAKSPVFLFSFSCGNIWFPGLVCLIYMKCPTWKTLNLTHRTWLDGFSTILAFIKNKKFKPFHGNHFHKPTTLPWFTLICGYLYFCVSNWLLII